jgi:hypothetical protein
MSYGSDGKYSPPPPMDSSSTRPLRELLVAAVLVTIAVIPLLFPRLPPESRDVYCGSLIDVRGPVRVFLNCDSDEFLLLAKNPALVLTPEHRTRQSRPLYGAIGWAFAAPFRVLGVSGRSGRLSGQYLPEYVGFIVLNWVLLIASVVLFKRLLGADSFFETRMLVPSAVLLVNEVTKAFFWTPHLQVFNIFIPVASLYLFWWMQPRLRTLTWGQVTAIGLLLGLGNLAYGAFAMTAAGAVLCILLGDGVGALRTQPGPRALRTTLLAAAFLTPLAAWMAFAKARTGTFYSHEIVVYRQFVWLADSASRGEFALFADLVQKLTDYLKTLATVALFPVLALAAVGLMTIVAAGRLSLRDEEGHTDRAILWYLLANIPFFALMGFYRTRLSWTIVPPLLLLLGHTIGRLERAMSHNGRAALRAGGAAIALGYVAYWFVRVGPYS